MPEYSTQENKKQEGISGAGTPEIGSVGIADKRFPHRAKKQDTFRFAERADYARLDDLATKYRTCATSMKFALDDQGRFHLRAGNFCRDRLCPYCNARKSHQRGTKLWQAMLRVEQDHPGARFLFLTLTFASMPGSDLPLWLDKLMDGWDAMTHGLRKWRRVVHGYYRTVEVTANTDEPVIMYHPHLHAILCVDGDYFSNPANYFDDRKQEVSDAWQHAMGLDYSPQVRLNVARAKDGRTAGESMAREAAKYPTKDKDVIGKGVTLAQGAEILELYHWVLKGRKLQQAAGWIMQAMKEIKLDKMALDEADMEPYNILTLLTFSWDRVLDNYVVRAVQTAEDDLKEQREAEQRALDAYIQAQGLGLPVEGHDNAKTT